MADVDGFGHVQRLHELSKVIGIGGEIVAVPGLAGPAMATTVMGDAPVAVAGEEEHLVFPSISRERPAMAEDDRLAPPPVLVVDLRAVRRGDRVHCVSFLSPGKNTVA